MFRPSQRGTSLVSVVSALALVTAAAAAPPVQKPPAAPQTGNAALVEQFVGAFNSRDLARIAELAADAVEWLSVSGATVSVETAGRQALLDSLKSYFASCPTCSSEVQILAVRGPFVSALERAKWSRNGQPLAQESFSVYEIRDGRILRVWYFPSVRQAE